VILVNFEGSQDLHWVGAQSIEASTDADEDRKKCNWQQTHREDILGIFPVGHVADSCEGHEQHHRVEDGKLQDGRVLILVKALRSDIHDDCIA
jgi:hypothetical protein